MKNIQLFFILIFFNSSFSLLCIDSTFDRIFSNSPKYFQVQPLKEACFKYKLSDIKNIISLTFTVCKSYTAEVLIYKSNNLIMMNEGEYFNYEEKYFIIDNNFREINVKDYYDYIYIIIRDSKNYYFYDNIILYDSELPIILEPNKPIDITRFMTNNKYIFNFSSEKNLQFIYSSKINSKKLLSVEYDGNKIIDKKIDTNDNIINLKNENGSNKLLKIIIENVDYTNDIINQEFSLIVYEINKNEFIEIKDNELIKINYIQNNLVQTFYFYSDISKYTTSSSINFKLDYNAKNNKYINIISDIIYSDIEIIPGNFMNLLPTKNNIEYNYDLNSDENIKFYFNSKGQDKPYKYIIFKFEIKDYGTYYKPKYFTISISKQIEEINLKNIKDYHTEIIKVNSNMNIPNYYKLLLNKDSNYIFSCQNQDYMTLLNGDLLTNNNSTINNKYIDNQKDITIISDSSELTMQIFDIELNQEKIYIEKIISSDITVIENERSNEEIKIVMTEEYCKNNMKKYFIGTYNKDKYGDNGISTTKYWRNEDGAEIELYFKNNLEIDNSSIFPISLQYKKMPLTPFILDTNIDLFTFKCNKPGTVVIKPLMKSFKEKTHIITQNSITSIALNSKEEILQLTSPLKLESNCDKYLYISIQTIQENNEVIIRPDIPNIFKENKIIENKIFYDKIDIDKYKSDELAIKIISDGMADIEVIEVIHYNFSEYFNITNQNKNIINKNNFVKFINQNTKTIKINIDGLNQVPIYYSLVKLAITDINYIPLVYNFKKDVIHKNCSKNEIIEIENKYYGKNDNIKEYIAFIFSIKNSNINYEYKVQIKEISDSIIKENSVVIIIIIVTIFVIMIGLIIYYRKKKKSQQGINIEGIKNNQPLFPNKKYVLNDMLNNNETI